MTNFKKVMENGCWFKALIPPWTNSVHSSTNERHSLISSHFSLHFGCVYSSPFLLFSSSTVNPPARCCAPATASSALPHIFALLSSFQPARHTVNTFIWLSFQLLCENFLSADGKVSEALAPQMGSWPDDETCKRWSRCSWNESQPWFHE